MRLITEENTIILSEKDLSALTTELAAPVNMLSLIPSIQPSENERKAAIAAFHSQVVDDGHFAAAIRALASPSQIARLHYSIADKVVSYIFLAWPSEDDTRVAFLTKMGDEFALSLNPVQVVKDVLSQVLMVDAKMASCGLHITLPAVAAIVFIAAADYLQEAWHSSMLNHRVPAESFTVMDIMARLKGTAAEDFRWPLLFFSKVIPVDIAATFSQDDINASLDRLIRLGLVDTYKEGKKSDGYMLTTEGKAISDSLLRSVSRVAMTISDAVDGGIGHEAFLFVRDIGYLWLFDLSGNQGAITSMASDSFNQLLTKLLTPPQIKKAVPDGSRQEKTAETAEKVAIKAIPEPTVKEPPKATGKSLCSQCGKEILPDAEFCANCGLDLKTAAKLCSSCSAELQAYDAFCPNCGKKLEESTSATTTP